MIDGFLGTRASIMFDVVAVSLLVLVPLLGWSIWLVRYRRAYVAHQRINTGIAAVLAAAVLLFEVDVQMAKFEGNGWRTRTTSSPYVGTPLDTMLYGHLAVATATTILLAVTVFRAWRGFPRPTVPSAHSAAHRVLGRLAAAGLLTTSITGWTFYWMAFVATG